MLRYLSLALVASLLLSACGGSSGGNNEPKDMNNSFKIKLLKEGGDLQECIWNETKNAINCPGINEFDTSSQLKYVAGSNSNPKNGVYLMAAKDKKTNDPMGTKIIINEGTDKKEFDSNISLDTRYYCDSRECKEEQVDIMLGLTHDGNVTGLENPIKKDKLKPVIYTYNYNQYIFFSASGKEECYKIKK